MRSRGTPRFWAAYADLPPEIKDAARKAYRLFRQDAHYPGLQFKKVHQRDPIYSIRGPWDTALSDFWTTPRSPGSGSAHTPRTSD